jgi:uncharacterized membrane protein
VRVCIQVATTVTPTAEVIMNTIARIGVTAAIALVPVGLYIATAPQPETSPAGIEAIRSLDANLAESAPQQSVVNGWKTNDLLTYMADQQDAYLAQQSVLLLVIALVGVVTVVAVLGKRHDTSSAHPVAHPPAARSASTPPTSPLPPASGAH